MPFGNLIQHVTDHPIRYLSAYFLILFILGLWPFNFTEKNNVSVNSDGGLMLARHGSAYTAFPARKLQDLKQFTIHIDLNTSSDGLNSFEKIFSYFINQEEMNFIIGQWKDSFLPVFRTEKVPSGIKLGIGNALKEGERAKFLISYDGRRLLVYQDGKVRNQRDPGPRPFENWESAYPLVIGSDANGRSQWKGRVYEIAVYDRAVMPGEVQGSKGSGVQKEIQVQGFRGSEVQGKKSGSEAQEYKGPRGDREEERPLIHYVFKQENTYETTFRGRKALVVRDLGKGEPADLVIPDQFTPYERVFLRWDNDWTRRSSDWLDVVVNIIGFVPFGVLLFVQLMKWGMGGTPVHGFKGSGVQGDEATSERSVKCYVLSGEKAVDSGQWPVDSADKVSKSKLVLLVILAVVVGFVVSFAIEYLQAYLPSRDSSLRDLICNTIGTLIGAVAAGVTE